MRVFKLVNNTNPTTPTATIATTPTVTTITTTGTVGGGISAGGGAGGGGGKMEARSVMCQMDHHAEVWRVEWNITGTILASSGDDGNVRFWKASLIGEWKLFSIIQGEEENNN